MPVKQRNKTNGNKGFSLVELIIAVAILAVITAIIVPSYLKYIEKSKKAVLENNAAGLADMVQIYAIDFGKSDWYGSWSSYVDGHGDAESSLNNYIEYELEVINDGSYENNVSLKNPYSGKMSVLDKNLPNEPGDGYRPAVFLTYDSDYAHEGSGDTDTIIGTIVVYFETGNDSSGPTDHIEVYYINKDGSHSDFMRTIS